MGTWGIGGFAERDPQNNDQKQIEAMRYAIDNGVNLIEATYWYSEGRSVELIKEAIRQSDKDREDIFITSTVYPYRNPTLLDAEREIDVLLATLETDYIDTLQFSLSSLLQWGRKDSINFINKCIVKNKSRYISVTNFDLDSLKEFKKEFGDKLFSHEVVLNFEIRENQDLGIIDYANKNDIKNFIFQPIRRNRTAQRNWPLLLELSEKYSKTQNQIILNWLIWKKCVPLTKSENIEHINETLGSINFKLEERDYLKIDLFRPKGWNPPKIDWYKTGDGQPIFMFPNIFDEEYNKQSKV